MQFEPIGGFPSIIKIDNTEIKKETLETRGFGTNIVGIGNIMKSNKKENLFMAFGNDDEEGFNYADSTFDNEPHDFQGIEYKNIPNRLSRIVKKMKNSSKNASTK